MFKIVKRIIKKIYKIKLKQEKKVYLKKNVNYTLNSFFEGNNKINKNSSIDNCIIGFGTYIGENCHFRNTKIGKYCSIASDVKTITTTHPTNTFVSTHPAFFSTKKQAGFTYVKTQKFEETKYLDIDNNISIEIGNDVWIGENVTILAGVKIGNGCIIGANSIVTKDLPSYSISVGNPAKIIKYRFDKETIILLEQYEWWNKPEKWIIQNIELFENIEKFMEVNKWKK